MAAPFGSNSPDEWRVAASLNIDGIILVCDTVLLCDNTTFVNTHFHMNMQL